MNQCNMRSISTNKAPKAIGPYSQAIIVNDLVFVSGQIPINPETNEMITTSFNDQVNQVLKNIKAILEEANSSINNVIKTTVFIKDIKNFAVFNEIYAQYFNENKPARSVVEVNNLPKDAQVEIEVIAKI